MSDINPEARAAAHEAYGEAFEGVDVALTSDEFNALDAALAAALPLLTAPAVEADDLDRYLTEGLQDPKRREAYEAAIRWAAVEATKQGIAAAIEAERDRQPAYHFARGLTEAAGIARRYGDTS